MQRMNRVRAQRGMAYLAVMFLVFCVVLAASAASIVWHLEARRGNEEDLLFKGQQFSHALASYQIRHKRAGLPYPMRLTELLGDDHSLSPQRDLRQIFFDPMTASTEWGLVRMPDGEIVGIYSRAKGQPIKKSNFPVGFESFASARAYSDWVFRPLAEAPPATPVPTAGVAANATPTRTGGRR